MRDLVEVLAGFRRDFHQALSRRTDGLFELADAGVGRSIAAGHWRPGDPQFWVVMDVG